MKKKSQPGPKRVIGYIRVSTERQVADGNSLEAQEARLKAYTCAFGLELVGIEVDAGESASTLTRPGLKRALLSLVVVHDDIVAWLDAFMVIFGA